METCSFVYVLFSFCTPAPPSIQCGDKTWLSTSLHTTVWYESKCSNHSYLFAHRHATAKSRQSCLTLCDPIVGSPPGSPIPGILQARTLEWVAISFSSAWKWKVKGKSLSRVRLLATPWTAAHQAPMSMGFSRQEYWSGVPLPFLAHRHNMDKKYLD